MLLNLYFFQPILVFWGLTNQTLESALLDSFGLYFLIIFITLAIILVLTKLLFSQKDGRSNILATSLVGNTGNLGIPLGIALFGEASVIYTSVINLANLFFIYTFSVYYFAGNKFAWRESLKSIAKIPIIWVAIIAIVFNLGDLKVHENIQNPLEMGAYTAIILQLSVFGMFLATIKTDNFDIKIVTFVSIIKMFVLPFVGFLVLQFFTIEPFVASIIMLELMMPLAVNNLNLASLYNAKPKETTLSILLSSLLFLLLAYYYIAIIQNYF